ncbi:MAG: endopeptidase La [Flavobacteriales bacterium]|nr:endopeptidase La [Flavobacteriales bacterium]
MNENNFGELLEFGGLMEGDTELIPLITPEDEEQMNKEETPDELAILPIRNNVLFPGVVIPITVGRDKSIRLINDAYKAKKVIGVVAQKKQDVEAPGFDDLNKIGTVAQVMRVLRMPDGSTTVIIQGKKRFEMNELISEEPYIRATVKQFMDVPHGLGDDKLEALISSLKDLSMNIIRLNPNIPSEAGFAIKNIESPTFLINFISSNMNATVEEKQMLLEKSDLNSRGELLLSLLSKDLQMLEMKNEIQSKVRVDIDRQQREYFLHQQMKTIQEELGESPVEQESRELKDRAKHKKWSKEVEKHFNKELEKMGRMNPSGAEYSVQLNYLETLVDLPWNVYTKDKFDLKKAQQILDRDHFGLEKVKERIIEYLAVLKLKGDMKSPILCLYGPPGVGKTSLGKSIAEALGRKYVRMSLGGLRDEAEIRGHRKTYVGAMPGRIIQNITKAESSNPVFVLDEIDKTGESYHGDPSSALLEVLDPEQNTSFYDNYLEVDYDLSKVMFIATANNLSTIQPALRDRMEIIEVTGYTIEEKLGIAKQHLIPKLLKEHGYDAKNFKISDAVIEKIIEEYTNESGVRGLEKRIGKLVRNRAKEIALNEKFKAEITEEQASKILGPSHQRDKYENNDHLGVVTGLAWTPVGGDILFIESILTAGKGKLSLTGNLGDVMKESAVIALEFLKSHARELKIDPKAFDQQNVHIHVPEGATPKDGPSAGITMLTALASQFTKRKVKKALAMTGEITLRGKVLPVGGIKEKILAARRAGIQEIILCDKNQKDIEDINPDYIKGLRFHYVNNMMDVLQIALLNDGNVKAKSTVKTSALKKAPKKVVAAVKTKKKALATVKKQKTKKVSGPKKRKK